MENRVTTNDLFVMIENADSFDPAFESLERHMNAPSFREYLRELMKRRGLDAGKLGVKSLLSRSFAFQICSGKRHPSRDIILRIAIAANLSVNETRQMLRLAKHGELYPRDKRDAVILYALTKKLDLYETDELLTSMEQRALL